MLDIATVIVSLFLYIIVSGIPEKFMLLNNIVANNIIAIILIESYFIFVFTAIWEVKSFIFNIFQLFNMYSVSRIIELLKQENKNN